MSGLFDGKVILVTGAGSGIGRAAAIGFAAEGGRVVASDINADSAAQTAEVIRSKGGMAFARTADVTQSADVKTLIEAAIKQYGGIDCACNNAGITDPNDDKWDEAVFRRIIDTNLQSQMLCMKYEIPAMLERGKGAICNMSSVLGLVGQTIPVVQAYTASKHAIIGLTRAAALQYAGLNIRVNALCPGVTRTPIVSAAMAQSPEVRRALESYAPLRGVAEPEEIAEGAIWLCSDKASFVTGHALVIDGGYTAR